MWIINVNIKLKPLQNLQGFLFYCIFAVRINLWSMYDIDEEIVELIKSETMRVGTRSGLPFILTQYEYEGTWKL